MENKDSSFTLEKEVMENTVLTAEEKEAFKDAEKYKRIYTDNMPNPAE